jgi:hypothetical protein
MLCGFSERSGTGAMEGEGRDRACGEKSATLEAGWRAGARRALRVRDVPDGARLRLRIPLDDRSIYALGCLGLMARLFLVPTRR